MNILITQEAVSNYSLHIIILLDTANDLVGLYYDNETIIS
jgi:hypothetical protein